MQHTSNHWHWLGAIACAGAAMLCGCAVTYTEKKSGVTHVVGLLHVKVPPSVEANQSFAVADVSSMGVAVAIQPEGSGLVVGYNRTQLVRAIHGAAQGSILISDGTVICIVNDASCVSEHLGAFK